MYRSTYLAICLPYRCYVRHRLRLLRARTTRIFFPSLTSRPFPHALLPPACRIQSLLRSPLGFRCFCHLSIYTPLPEEVCIIYGNRIGKEERAMGRENDETGRMDDSLACFPRFRIMPITRETDLVRGRMQSSVRSVAQSLQGRRQRELQRKERKEK